MPVHVTVWEEAGKDTPAVVLVHGSMTWGAACFESQRSLAAGYRLLVVDRRGYGSSPDIDHSDYDVDAADVVELLGEAAHVVGHSYGGVVAMLAAGCRPQAVRSLALIRAIYPAFGQSDGRPDAGSDARPLEGGVDGAAGTPKLGCALPIEPLAAATWPELVITGTWETASSHYRAWVGEAMTACGRIVAERIGAELVSVPGAAHEPHREQPLVVNTALRELWDRGRGASRHRMALTNLDDAPPRSAISYEFGQECETGSQGDT